MSEDEMKADDLLGKAGKAGKAQSPALHTSSSVPFRSNNMALIYYVGGDYFTIW